MQATTEMRQGWDFAAGIMGADIAAHMGQEYVGSVEAAIQQLEYSINNHAYRNLGVGQLKGYMLEEWAAETFNVDATAAGSSDRASVLHSNAKNSVDIQLESGGKYSAKVYATPEQTAKAQAYFNQETGQADYYGQKRLVTTDHLPGAKDVTHHEALRNQEIRPKVSDAFAETETNLTDTIKNKEGVSSRGVTKKELEEISRESKEQSFHPEEHGVTPDSAIRTEYLLKQALKAGYTAAAITVAVQLAPEIYKAIDYLIKHGEIDVQRIRKIGEKGISASAEGFLHGSVSSALFITCKKGALGAAFQSIGSTELGIVVALVMQTVKNSVLVAAGQMTAQQMGAAFAETLVVSGGCLFGAQIVGAIGQALGFQLPVLGLLLGTLIGSSFSVVYNIGKRKLISFCADTGFTCFGLVEQNYELPDEVLHELGVETIPIPRTRVDRTDIPRTAVMSANVGKSGYETISMTALRRGVIGVNKIGYVLA